MDKNNKLKNHLKIVNVGIIVSELSNMPLVQKISETISKAIAQSPSINITLFYVRKSNMPRPIKIECPIQSIMNVTDHIDVFVLPEENTRKACQFLDLEPFVVVDLEREVDLVELAAKYQRKQRNA